MIMVAKDFVFGLVGAGAMGTEVARAFDRGDIGGSLGVIYDLDVVSAKKLGNILSKPPHIASTQEELFARCNFLIEAASQQAVRTVIHDGILAEKDVLIMSAGVLLDEELWKKLVDDARSLGVKIHIPSGALAGVDGLIGASAAGIDEVSLTSTKPPDGFKGVPYIEEKGIDLDSLTEATIIFEGPASQAARLFPKNINVSAIVSLASGKKIDVKIVADPNAKRNTHEIKARGAFGELSCKTSNVPSPANPKTSYLAMLSVISTLKQITMTVKIGN